jgi:hypothetical protein
MEIILIKLLSEFNKASLRLCVDGFVALTSVAYELISRLNNLSTSPL